MLDAVFSITDAPTHTSIASDEPAVSHGALVANMLEERRCYEPPRVILARTDGGPLCGWYSRLSGSL